MPVFRFHCPSCSELIRNFVDHLNTSEGRYKFCPYCGTELVQRGNNAVAPSPQHKRNVRIPVEDFKKLLSPLVELNGYVWLAQRIGVHESRVRAVFEQNYVTFDLVDRWLTNLGLTNALTDGSLRTIEYREGKQYDN